MAKRSGFIIFSVSILLLVLIIFGYKQYQVKKQNQAEPKLVEGYPASPVYPESKLVSSAKEPQPEEGDFSYHGAWETTDSVPVVMAWYLEKLPKENWFIDNYPAQDQADLIQYLDAHKNDDRTFILQLSVIREPNTKITKVILEYPAKSTGNEDEEMEW